MAGRSSTHWCRLARVCAGPKPQQDAWHTGVRVEVGAAGSIEAIEVGVVAEPEDLRYDLVIPGMPNLHSHAFQRALVGRVERGGPTSDSFWTWREGMYELAGKLTPSMVEAISAQLFVEALEAGYTHIGEFHYIHRYSQSDRWSEALDLAMALSIDRAAKDSGIQVSLLPAVYLHGGFGTPLSRRQMQFRWSEEDRFLDGLGELKCRTEAVELGLAFHSLRAVHPDSIERLVRRAKAEAEPPVRFHIHVSEQPAEVASCLESFGKTPVTLLAERVDLDASWCLVHGTHATDDELSIIAEAGATVGLCPTTEANLGDGFFPLQRFIELGGAFGVGSDSQVSVDPREELRWLEYQARLSTGQRNCLSARDGAASLPDLWFRACEGGGRALGYPGRIEVGAAANWIDLDTGHSRCVGLEPDEVVAAWILGASALASTVVRGEPLVRNGAHTGRAPIFRRFVDVMESLR